MADIKKVIAWLADTELYYQQEGSESHDSDHQCRMAHDALSVIEQMEQERRWIPVSERLPELYTTVLVAVYGKRVTYCQVWLFGKEKGWTLEGVTHWMPLPQPPKKDGDGECAE